MSVSARLATGKPTSASARADRYLARLDERLAHQRAPERRAFLTWLYGAWEYQRKRFIETDGASEPCTDPADPPHLVDFTLTLAGIAARLTAERQS